MALDEAEEFELSYKAADDLLNSCYVLRCLERFAIFFGLVDVEWGSKGFFDRRFKLKRSSLLDQVVKFHI